MCWASRSGHGALAAVAGRSRSGLGESSEYGDVAVCAVVLCGVDGVGGRVDVDVLRDGSDVYLAGPGGAAAGVPGAAVRSVQAVRLRPIDRPAPRRDWEICTVLARGCFTRGQLTVTVVVVGRFCILRVLNGAKGRAIGFW